MAKMTVPTKADVQKKWVDEAPKRAAYYETEASKAGATWAAETTAAAPTYKSAVQAANIDKMFSGGVKRAGAAKFERKVKSVGVARFAPGIAAAETDFGDGVDPFLAVLAATEIPQRGPRGDAANYAIVQKVGDPLHKKRLAIRAAVGA